MRSEEEEEEEKNLPLERICLRRSDTKEKVFFYSIQIHAVKNRLPIYLDMYEYNTVSVSM